MYPWCRSGYKLVIPDDWIEKKIEEVTGVKTLEIDNNIILPKDTNDSKFYKEIIESDKGYSEVEKALKKCKGRFGCR